MPLQFDVGKGIRGYYALIRNDEEIIQTGIGSYRTVFEAYEEAVDWARSEGADREVMRLLCEMARWVKE